MSQRAAASSPYHDLMRSGTESMAYGRGATQAMCRTPARTGAHTAQCTKQSTWSE
eukprot:CAMPEP_0179853402 /NCGR_PEP_ID=MMETSP0982-20121206/9339_1 /TAXON_ID=483367 /ORGANISM="non described non described, Strain CCMP 2436" /LENGTH=54 /DNA_ID=CAMNT_0021739135 /DNA_START=426 /DNA_END=590 /DNA_ORIENTATION=-